MHQSTTMASADFLYSINQHYC